MSSQSLNVALTPAGRSQDLAGERHVALKGTSKNSLELALLLALHAEAGGQGGLSRTLQEDLASSDEVWTRCLTQDAAMEGWQPAVHLPPRCEKMEKSGSSLVA